MKGFIFGLLNIGWPWQAEDKLRPPVLHLFQYRSSPTGFPGSVDRIIEVAFRRLFHGQRLNCISNRYAR